MGRQGGGKSLGYGGQPASPAYLMSVPGFGEMDSVCENYIWGCPLASTCMSIHGLKSKRNPKSVFLDFSDGKILKFRNILT